MINIKPYIPKCVSYFRLSLKMIIYTINAKANTDNIIILVYNYIYVLGEENEVIQNDRQFTTLY